MFKCFLFLFLLLPSLAHAAIGLDFPCNGSGTVQFRFTGANLIQQWPATYIWRIRPKQQNGYYTTFFWGTTDNNFNGDVDPYYGAHPYPNPPPDGSAHNWEISINHIDDQVDENGNNTTVTTGQWHTQALVAEAAPGDEMQVSFYWNIGVNTNRLIRHTTEFADYLLEYPPANPGLTFGDAPWSANNEMLCGVLRGVQMYATALSLSDIVTEAANDSSNTPQTAAGLANVWYMNQNPTPSDISDRSGEGHNPAWVGANRPVLFSDEPPTGLIISSKEMRRDYAKIRQ